MYLALSRAASRTLFICIHSYNNPLRYIDPSGHTVEPPCLFLCPGDEPIDISNWSWVGKKAAQLGCTLLLSCNVDLEQEAINAPSSQQYTDYLNGQLMGLAVPLSAVNPVASQGGGIVRRYTQALLDKLGDFAQNTKWGSTWTAFAQASSDQVFVSLVDDEIAGAAMFNTYTKPEVRSLIGGKDALYFMGLEVGENYQTRGIGTDLLNAVLQESVDRGYEGRIYGYILSGDPDALQWIINRGATILDEGSRLFYFDEAAAASILNGG